MVKAGINSEFNKLKTVIIHKPGPEVENMTPATAERALYSDILNLPVAEKEFSSFKKVLCKVADVIELRELLEATLKQESAKIEILEQLSIFRKYPELANSLLALPEDKLAAALIEGVPLPQVSLSNFLKNDKFAINPLHNMFFMRDASFTIGNNVYVSSMAKPIRKPETSLLETIYKHSLNSNCKVVNLNQNDPKITIEGGDVLVVSSDTLLIGLGSRTTSEAIDRLIAEVSKHQPLKHVIVQELPERPESFIHLDMVFTLLSGNECMVYKPVIMEDAHYHTILMNISDGKATSIEYVKDIIEGLKRCGKDYTPVFCGNGDPLLQEREQWHSGANFFSFGPGKIIGYSRNRHTAEALNKAGYEVLSAKDVVDKDINIDKINKCLITIEGAELARGGGGPRCMTMPILRD